MIQIIHDIYIIPHLIAKVKQKNIFEKIKLF